MPFNFCNGTKYFSFNSLSEHKIIHGVFTRHGGVSSAPYASLNIGGSNGDRKEDVIENRHRLFDAVGLDMNHYFDVWQVHSNRVIATTSPRSQNEPQQQADAIITNTPGLSLLMRFGDCVPILLYDPGKKVIGIVHAGWIGTLKRVCQNAVNQMSHTYNCCAGDIVASIGPSISVDHYEVGYEVLHQFQAQFGEDADQFFYLPQDGKPHLDLWAANEYQLKYAGVGTIENSRICTACHSDDWYSHRQEKGKTGRFGAVISLKEK